MSDWASLNGARLLSGSIAIPKVGLWVADVTLAIASAVAGLVTLIVGDLSLVGSIVRSGAYGGTSSYRLVGGYGGWRKRLPARAYASVSGVTSQIVIGDLAIECGEQVGPITPKILGASSYARLAGRASRSLAAITPTWRVDPLGVTQFTPWVPNVVKTLFTPTDRAGAPGEVEVATENPGAWLPGALFTSPLLGPEALEAQSVRHYWSGDGVSRVKVLIA